MANEYDPIVGNWYRVTNRRQEFEVVAVDEDEGLIQVQYFDGDLEEMEREAWEELALELSDPPEDWTGPVDVVELGDTVYMQNDLEAPPWGDEPPESGSDERNWD